MGLVSSPDCLFCKIAARKVETAVLYEDDRAMAFRDINPKAPVHVLVIPKEHVVSLAACGKKEEPLLGHLMLVARNLAESENLSKNGYRVVANIGSYGGQTVAHFHLHLLGGRSLGWPPG
jgi:histidine triad (HIT) family protein